MGRPSVHNTLRRMSAIIGVPAVAAAVTLTTAGSAYASGPTERAVVVLSGSTVTAPGVKVLSTLTSLHLELVEGTAAAIAQLAHTPGVSGITPDRPITFMSKNGDKASSAAGKSSGNSGNGSKGTDDGAVYASDGLGGPAGTKNAGAGVTVAVIDTGVSDTPALNRASGRLFDGIDTSGLVDGGDVTESGVFTDGYGHGTFMANVIAGGAVSGSHTNLGVAPAARVAVVKVANSDGESSLLAVMAALNWVATHADQVQVANLALGIDAPSGAYGPDPLNVATEWVRAAGVNVVVAAGNTPGQVADPGFTAGALTVGAADTTTSQATVAPFSGSAVVAGVAKPDVVATGVSVLSLLPETSEIALLHPESRTSSGLFRGSGTSQATAVTSGLAAIFLQHNPNADTTQVKESIRASARPLSDGRAGAGVARTTLEPSNSAGDGESSFDATSWMAGAYAGPGFTMQDWLSDLSLAWFGDSTIGAQWSDQRWQASLWRSSLWRGSLWRASLWRGSLWRGSLWRSSLWRSSLWRSSLWRASLWHAQGWQTSQSLPATDSTQTGASL
jgi:serine protease AprX